MLRLHLDLLETEATARREAINDGRTPCNSGKALHHKVRSIGIVFAQSNYMT